MNTAYEQLFVFGSTDFNSLWVRPLRDRRNIGCVPYSPAPAFRVRGPHLYVDGRAVPHPVETVFLKLAGHFIPKLLVLVGTNSCACFVEKAALPAAITGIWYIYMDRYRKTETLLQIPTRNWTKCHKEVFRASARHWWREVLGSDLRGSRPTITAILEQIGWNKHTASTKTFSSYSPYIFYLLQDGCQCLGGG